MDDIIAQFKGVTGTMELYEDRIIYRTHFLGDHGERTYFLDNINSLQINEPTFLRNGFVRIFTGSSNNISNFDTYALANDPDTLIFNKKNMKDAVDFHKKASNLLAKAHKKEKE